MLPGVLLLAHVLDDELATRGGTAISAGLVGEIAADITRAFGALTYFLRATRVVLHATASARDVGIEELLATTGQRLAESCA